MISNKITPGLKKAFLEEIKKTKDTGREHGFPICMDNKGELSAPEKRRKGKESGFTIRNVHEYCPDRVQGGFHTHPFLIDVERFYGRKPTEKEIERAFNIYKEHFEREGITVQTPSHHDLTDTLINQCRRYSEGTVCTGSDLDMEKVECWTVKPEKVKIKDCSQATEEHKQRIAKSPREWIRPLFEKEIIKLKKG